MAGLSERETRWLGEGAVGPVNVFRGVAAYRSADGRRILLSLEGPADAPPAEGEEWKNVRLLLLLVGRRRGAVRKLGVREIEAHAGQGCTLVAPSYHPSLVVECPDGRQAEIHRPYGWERDLMIGWRAPVDEVLELLRLSGRRQVEAFKGWLVARLPRNRRIYMSKLEEEQA